MARQSTRRDDQMLTFLVLDETRIAYTAISALIEEPQNGRGRLLLIYGPSGCGKSHLASLLTRDVKRRLQANVTELPAAELLVINAEKVADLCGLADVGASQPVARLVVCEDIQSLARQATAQANLVFLIDEARRLGVDVVLTANRSPGDVSGLSNRLRSRLRGGVCVAVKTPSAASREKLIAHFCSHLQLPMTAAAGRLVARQLAVSPRELLGAVRRFDLLARQHREALDVPFARAFLTHEMAPQTITIDDVAKAVAKEFSVKLADIRSESRDQHIKTARQCAMFLARELTGSKFAAIGEYFGNRSHSTVMHACQRIQSQMENDASLRQRLGTVKQSLS